jgi:hypothetical protein
MVERDSGAAKVKKAHTVLSRCYRDRASRSRFMPVRVAPGKRAVGVYSKEDHIIARGHPEVTSCVVLAASKAYASHSGERQRGRRQSDSETRQRTAASR